MSLLDRFKRNKPAAPQAPAKTAAGAKAVAAAAAKTDESAKHSRAEKKAEKKAVKAGKKAAEKAAKKDIKIGRAHRVLLHPIVTEKATMTGTYQFAVVRTANKNEVKQAIQQVYGVKPQAVRMMNVGGKQTRWNYRQGVRQDWKKAVVQLPRGQTINVYEGT